MRDCAICCDDDADNDDDVETVEGPRLRCAAVAAAAAAAAAGGAGATWPWWLSGLQVVTPVTATPPATESVEKINALPAGVIINGARTTTGPGRPTPRPWPRPHPYMS